MPTTRACSGLLHGTEANWIGWQFWPQPSATKWWGHECPPAHPCPLHRGLAPSPPVYAVVEACVGGIQLVQPGTDLAVVMWVAGQVGGGGHATARIAHQHFAMSAQHACSGPGAPTVALLLEVTGRMGVTRATAGTCPACCATGHTPSCKPVLGASMEGAMFVAAQPWQQGNNRWCFAHFFCTPLSRHMVAAEGNAVAVLASSGAHRQPQPGRPGWVRPPMTGGHILGHNSAPRRQMEAREVAMESLQREGFNELAQGPKSAFWRARKVHFWRQHLGHTWDTRDGHHSRRHRKSRRRAVRHDATCMGAGLGVAANGNRRGMGSPMWRAGWKHVPHPCHHPLICKLIFHSLSASLVPARILG